MDRNKLSPIPPQSGPLHESDRYVICALSMQALISYAYNTPENEILGGPSWLEFNRYDIEAKTPTTTSDADVRLMMKALLDERFHLAVRKVSVPLPIRALYLEKGASKLKASDGKGDPGCKVQPPAPGDQVLVFDCHNQTIEDLAQRLRDPAGWQDKRPVVDETGSERRLRLQTVVERLDGGGLGRWSSRAVVCGCAVGARPEDCQRTAPHGALIVDSVDEDPAAGPAPNGDQLCHRGHCRSLTFR